VFRFLAVVVVIIAFFVCVFFVCVGLYVVFGPSQCYLFLLIQFFFAFFVVCVVCVVVFDYLIVLVKVYCNPA